MVRDAMEIESCSVSQSARLLGYFGLLPQLAAILAMLFGGPDLYWIAVAIAYAYAAFIFSFLGGIWWGFGMAMAGPRPRWIFAAAVLPSLLALATYVPWVMGWRWPQPSLIILGCAIILSPMVDICMLRGQHHFTGWLRLRCQLSWALGGMTLAVALL